MDILINRVVQIVAKLRYRNGCCPVGVQNTQQIWTLVHFVRNINGGAIYCWDLQSSARCMHGKMIGVLI